jgi:hypothetical protein
MSVKAVGGMLMKLTPVSSIFPTFLVPNQAAVTLSLFSFFTIQAVLGN